MLAHGAGGCSLSAEQLEMDEALEAIYASDSDEEISRDEWESPTDGRPHGAVKGRTFPRVARWLDQIRNFFPKDVVVLLRRTPSSGAGMKELLFEPEMLAKVEPSIDLARTVLALKNMVPEKAKAAARDLVRRVVEEVRKRLESQFAQAIRGALDRNRHSPFRSLPNLDWPRTIRRNLKNYNPELKTIIPEHISFFSRQQRQNRVEHHHRHGPVRLDGDVADLRRHHGRDPGQHAGRGNARRRLQPRGRRRSDRALLRPGRSAVRRAARRGGGLLEGDLLLRAVHAHAGQDAVHPAGRPARHQPQRKRFVKKMEFLLESGVKAIGLLAISDQGQPSYNENLAEKLAKLGMPCFGCTPDRLPDLLAAVFKGNGFCTIRRKRPPATKNPARSLRSRGVLVKNPAIPTLALLVLPSALKA